MSKEKAKYRQVLESPSQSDDDYSGDESEAGLAGLNRMMEKGIKEARETEEQRSSRPRPAMPINHEKFKRQMFKKIGYEGYKKDEAVPDEIFQMLWLI